MTYGSVYEITNPLTKIAGEHQVSWFSGKGKSGSASSGTVTGVVEGWSVTFITGTCSYGMENTIDGGFKIATSGGTTNETISLNNGAGTTTGTWVDPEGSEWIAIIKLAQSTNHAETKWGVKDDQGRTTARSECVVFADTANYSNWRLRTSSHSQSETQADLGIPFDTDWHVWKGTQTPTTASISCDGVLSGSATNKADTVQHGIFMLNSSTSATHQGYCRYFEVYNT